MYSERSRDDTSLNHIPYMPDCQVEEWFLVGVLNLTVPESGSPAFGSSSIKPNAKVLVLPYSIRGKASPL